MLPYVRHLGDVSRDPPRLDSRFDWGPLAGDWAGKFRMKILSHDIDYLLKFPVVNLPTTS